MVDKDKIGIQINKLKTIGYNVYAYNNWAIVFGQGREYQCLDVQNNKIYNDKYFEYEIHGDFVQFTGFSDKKSLINYVYLPNRGNVLSRYKRQFIAVYSLDGRVVFLHNMDLDYYIVINNCGKVKKITPSYVPFIPSDIIINNNLDGTYLVSEYRMGYNHGDINTIKDELILIDFNLNIIKDFRR